ncbi:MAG: hypothetical protein WCI27_01335 [Candidatus Omnitrophota bacterium]
MMNKKTIFELITVAVLILIFIFLAFQAFKKVKPPVRPSPVAVRALSEKIMPGVAALLGQDRPGPLVLPIISKDATKAKKVAVEKDLTGILWSKNDPEAIIKHAIVKVGDTVDGKTVVDIKKDKVVLSDGIKELELEL